MCNIVYVFLREEKVVAKMTVATRTGHTETGHQGTVTAVTAAETETAGRERAAGAKRRREIAGTKDIS